jgi:hypothetical protein
VLPTFAEIIEVRRQAAELEKDDLHEDEPPAGPASEADIAAAVERYGDKLSPAYLAFLRQHDGWQGCPWDMALFSAEDLCGGAYEWAVEVFGYSVEARTDDEPYSDELMSAVFIGQGENSGSDLRVDQLVGPVRACRRGRDADQFSHGWFLHCSWAVRGSGQMCWRGCGLPVPVPVLSSSRRLSR